MLTVHRGSRADLLVARLGDLLATPASDDPFVPEVVAVHSRGVERWIAQQLSRRLGATAVDDGVAATIEFPFPASVVEQATRAALGEPPAGPGAATDPWRAADLTFTLLDLVDRGVVGLPDLDAFGVHLAGSADRRLPAMRHAAELIDSYQQHRPDMVMAWTRWDGSGAPPDGRGGTLPPRVAWQARLTLAARDALGETRAERAARAVAALDAGRGPVTDLPPRISLFALTALAPAHFRVLDALARRIDVHVFLLHASPAAWARTATVAATAPPPGQPRVPRTELPAPRGGHPLLRRWGRDSRELQVLLAGRGHDDLLDEPTASPPSTLLERLQADIRADRAVDRDAADPWTLHEDDRSVQVHGAHGRHRQVEVARDAILEALAADPTLQPRDVVVMTPDIEEFAPLVDAAFRAAARDDSGIPDLRVRLADRALTTVNPLLATIAHLLELADSRLEVGAVLELLQREPVRRAFDLDAQDIERIDDWVGQAGVKWGLDHDHRRRHDLPADNTWQFGLDRVLAGVALADGRLGDDVLALDTTAVAVDHVGIVAEYVARLRHVTGRMQAGGDHGHAIGTWVEVLREAADLLTATSATTQWQRWQFDTLLDDLGERAGTTTAGVTLHELRTLLASDLGGRPTRANHQTGDLTVCSLVPMRTVPFRMVVVVGLDDGAFPRVRTRAGDDVLGMQALVGDRDPTSEDRQLLLDALMAATDRFVVTHRSAHQSTNRPVPPAVVVSELLDAVDDTVGGTGGAAEIHQHHFLRAADPRAFRGARPAFDRIALAGARAAAAPPRTAVPVALDPPAPSEVPPPPATMTVHQVIDVLRAPARSYMRHVFGFTDRAWEDARDDNLTVEATGLAGWSLGDQLLGALMDDIDLDRVVQHLRAAGQLPVGRLARTALDEHLPLATTIATVARDAVAATAPGPDGPTTVELDMADVALRGVASPDHPGLFLTTSYSSHKPGRLVAPWVRVLATAAMGRPTRAVHVTKRHSVTKTMAVTAWEFTPPGQADARNLLADLVAVTRHLLTHPVPFFPNTSGCYWEAAWKEKDEDARLSAAGRAWLRGWPDKYGEGTDANVVHLFGDAPLTDLARIRTATPDPCPDWWDDRDMPHELARWARRVYGPLFAHVQWTDHPLAPLDAQVSA